MARKNTQVENEAPEEPQGEPERAQEAISLPDGGEVGSAEDDALRAAEEVAKEKEEFIQAVRAMAANEGYLQMVECDLPGYEGVKVWYNVDNAYAVAQLWQRLPKGLPSTEHFRFWGLFVKRIEWDRKDLDGNPIPAPIPTDPESMRVLWEQFRSFALWVRWKGYEMAKRDAWGN
jgi:hypothetical protein